jgi:hypothetical protein
MSQRSDEQLLKVFEPRDSHETVRAWALHTTRRRMIHEQEARRLDWFRWVLGTVATCLAAAAGTSAFAAWQSPDPSTGAAVTTAVIGVGAAVLGSIMTFLDLGGRAEAHRRTASDYKRVMRVFEEASGSTAEASGSTATSEQLVSGLMPLLADADRHAPTVPLKRAQKVEQRSFCFVSTANELAPNPCKEKGACEDQEQRHAPR